MYEDEEVFKEMMDAQKEEMYRYKWTESEKAGHDVGKGVYLEWITRYAASWRETWNRTHL